MNEIAQITIYSKGNLFAAYCERPSKRGGKRLIGSSLQSTPGIALERLAERLGWKEKK